MNTTSVLYIRQLCVCVCVVFDVCNVIKYWVCSFGINICFAPNLTGYIKTWLKFVFSICIFVITAVIVICASFFSVFLVHSVSQSLHFKRVMWFHDFSPKHLLPVIQSPMKNKLPTADFLFKREFNLYNKSDGDQSTLNQANAIQNYSAKLLLN